MELGLADFRVTSHDATRRFWQCTRAASSTISHCASTDATCMTISGIAIAATVMLAWCGAAARPLGGQRRWTRIRRCGLKSGPAKTNRGIS